MDLVLRDESIDGPSGTLLVGAFEREIAGFYRGWHRGVGPTAAAAELTAPDGAFLVAYLAREPVGCGGFKRLDASCAEVKRMFVAPQARGMGVGRRLLVRLEQLARAADYEVLRLDTGTPQIAAQGLYRSSGYRAIPDYNGNPVATLWFEKRL